MQAMTSAAEAAAAGAQAAATPSLTRRIAEAFGRWKKARQVERELSMLTARELADLGLSPSDIHAVARGTFRMPD